MQLRRRASNRAKSVVIVPPAPLTISAASAIGLITINRTSLAQGGVSYALYRSTSPSVTTSGSPISTTFPFNDTSVVDGTTYYYVASATNEGGTVTSNVVSGTPEAIPTGDIFPLSIASNQRSLQTAQGDAFVYLADTAWLAPHKLDQDEFTTYATTRKQQGFTAIQMSILGFQSVDGITNAYGKTPFTTTGDLTTPRIIGAATTNDASADYDYWDHLVWMVDKAAEVGLFVNLVPCWYGYAGADWRGYLNSTAEATSYGTFLGNLLNDRINIMWMFGGDNAPVGDVAKVPSGADTSDITSETNSLANALKTAWGNNSPWLATYHTGRNETVWEYFGTQSWYTLHAAYSAELCYPYVIAEYNRTTVKPVILVESHYDNRPTSPILSRADLRYEAYSSFLSGASAFAYGYNGVWQLDTSWQSYLSAGSAVDNTLVRKVMETYATKTLQPDHRSGNSTKFLSAGYGTSGSGSYAVSATASDDSCGIAYFPDTRTGITVNLNAFSGNVWLSWVHPQTGSVTSAGSNLSGSSQAVTFPSGWADALLIARTDNSAPVATMSF